MRIARGIQNKVMEAMSMAKPVIVIDALENIATPLDVILANDPAAFARPLSAWTGTRRRRKPSAPALASGRELRWEGRLAGFDPLLAA